MHFLPPASGRDPTPERSSRVESRHLPKKRNSDRLRAQKKTLSLVIVGLSGEQWLDIALAMHTIEMIPKSMILKILMQSSFYLYKFRRLSSK